MTELPPPDAASVARMRGQPPSFPAPSAPMPIATPAGIPTWPNPGFVRPVLAERREPAPTLPLIAAVGAIIVLTASLIASKYVLEALVEFEWPLIVYIAVTATIGYGPSVAWCLYVSRRWGTGRVSTDIGLAPRWADIGWGPVIWLAALGAQLAVAALVVGLDVPISNNTDGVTELQADRTYIVSLVITAVVAAPIVEEMVFRGVVLRSLRSRMPAVVAIVVQGVLFGAAHIDPIRGAGNLGLVMVLSGVGIAFGAAAVLLRRIGPVIVAHAIFNGAVLLIVLTGVADRLQDAAVSSVLMSGVLISGVLTSGLPLP
jgi:membrane protease YdiL (CAAX protease family)